MVIAGVGAIYVRRRPRVRIEAPQSGGGQERGMRSGTVPTPLVVGLGAACELAAQEMEVGGKLVASFHSTHEYSWFGQVMELRLSRYLVLLSSNKTAAVSWSDPILLHSMLQPSCVKAMVYTL